MSGSGILAQAESADLPYNPVSCSIRGTCAVCKHIHCTCTCN